MAVHRRCAGTCANCGRAFIRQVRIGRGWRWTCPYCLVRQDGPAKIEQLLRTARGQVYKRALRDRDRRASLRRQARLRDRAKALRELEARK